MLPNTLHSNTATQENCHNIYQVNTDVTNSMTDNGIYAGLQSHTSTSLSDTYEDVVVYEEPDKAFPENIRPVLNIAYKKSLNIKDGQRLRPVSS